MERKTSFLEAATIPDHSVVSVVGAGGKTSLLFQLGKEMRAKGKRCVLTTSTRMYIPKENQVDFLDLSGGFFGSAPPAGPCILVVGRPLADGKKMRGPELDLLAASHHEYDLTAIEGDGSAGKPLKGWKDTEPVVPAFTTHTVGIVDIQVLGKNIDVSRVHRLEIFTELTKSVVGGTLNLDHLVKLIAHPQGLFAKAVGKKILYINKVESADDLGNARKLKIFFPQIHCVMGSLKEGWFHG